MDIPSSAVKINTDETTGNAPSSMALFTKLGASINALFDADTSEASTRASADTTLQTNINTLAAKVNCKVMTFTSSAVTAAGTVHIAVAVLNGATNNLWITLAGNYKYEVTTTGLHLTISGATITPPNHVDCKGFALYTP